VGVLATAGRGSGGPVAPPAAFARAQLDGDEGLVLAGGALDR
jgi:hypothetical protein